MLEKIKATAEARRQADLEALGDIKERVAELVSPRTAALVGGLVLRRAIDEGLGADLCVGLSAGIAGSELAMEARIARARVTPETIAEIEALKPAPPPLLAPFIDRLETSIGWLIADLTRRKAELEGAPKVFSEVEVSGTVGLDMQVASMSVTVMAIWED